MREWRGVRPLPIKGMARKMEKSADLGLKRFIGRADCCELAACAFAFPDERLAEALCDGSFSSDARECLADTGVARDAIEAVERGLGIFRGNDPEGLFAMLKREYSLLFLVPGANARVWPYESAFRHAAERKGGAPVLFRSPVALNVEATMLDCGIRAENDRREPCDALWNEFSFLSYLYGAAAQAAFEGSAIRVEEHLAKARAFQVAHIDVWLADCMAAIVKESSSLVQGGCYAALAQFGAEVCGALAAGPFEARP